MKLSKIMALGGRILAASAILLSLALPASAQTSRIQVKGVVKDAGGEPVIAAAVYEKGNNSNGAVTDLDGRFTLTVPENAVLVTTNIGYETVEMKAASQMIIVIKESAQFIEETIVVGYGTQKKESVVGAIAQIDNEAIVNSGLTNVTQAIAGKLSGVLTMQSSGQPGANDATILVRGVSSWNGSAPLVMVDGVEREFSELDPNEIASISVLKDASATAVFGAKGANGVILVTTRNGVKSKPSLSLKVSHGLNFATGIPEHISAYDTAEAFNVALRNNGQFSAQYSDYALSQYRNPDSELNALRYPDVDWYKLLLRKCSHNTDANLNFSGGTDKVRYFFSTGYKNEGSIFKELTDGASYSYDRINYRANLDFDITKYTVLSFRAGGSIGVKKNPSSPIDGMYSTSTILFPAYYPAWLLDQMPDKDYPNADEDRFANPEYFGSYYGNPYKDLAKPSYNQTTSTTLFTDLQLDQKLDFITQGLSVKGKFSFSTTMSRTSESVSKSLTSYGIDWALYDAGVGNPWVASQTSTIVVEDPPYSASQGGVNSYSYALYWEGSLNYDRTFNRHHVTGLALFNQREQVSKSEFPYRTEGIVGRVTYDYQQKYLFEGNVGYTGSEQFAPANRFGIFPSVALGYVISKEKFWQQAMPWWNKMKFRYSDGIVGNDKVKGDERWLYISSYNYAGSYLAESEAANITARWETARKQDLGLEMSWFNNRLNLNVDLFQEKRTGMLVDPIITILVGASSKVVNKGEMQKHGMEYEFEWKDRLSNGLSYNVTAMYSFNENRILNYEDPPYSPDYQKTAGKAHGSQTYGESLVDGGYFNDVDDIHNYTAFSANWDLVPVGGYKYLDYKADGTIDTNDMHAVTGSIYPSTLCSFGGGLKYKGFEFSLLFYGNFGKYVDYNGAFEMDFVKNDLRISKSMSDYWRPDHHDAGHATMVYRGASGHPMYTFAGITGANSADMGLVGRTWRKADYLNLRDIYFGYTFDTKSMKAITGINSMSVYLMGNNLFYITSLLEGNPEGKSFVNGFYPLMRTFQLGLKVGF